METKYYLTHQNTTNIFWFSICSHGQVATHSLQLIFHYIQLCGRDEALSISLSHEVAHYVYLKDKTLEDSEECCSTGMQCENNVIDLDRIDSSWVVIRVLLLKGVKGEEGEEVQGGELGLRRKRRECKGKDDGRGGEGGWRGKKRGGEEEEKGGRKRGMGS